MGPLCFLILWFNLLILSFINSVPGIAFRLSKSYGNENILFEQSKCTNKIWYTRPNHNRSTNTNNYKHCYISIRFPLKNTKLLQAFNSDSPNIPINTTYLDDINEEKLTELLKLNKIFITNAQDRYKLKAIVSILQSRAQTDKDDSFYLLFEEKLSSNQSYTNNHEFQNKTSASFFLQKPCQNKQKQNFNELQNNYHTSFKNTERQQNIILDLWNQIEIDNIPYNENEIIKILKPNYFPYRNFQENSNQYSWITYNDHPLETGKLSNENDGFISPRGYMNSNNLSFASIKGSLRREVIHLESIITPYTAKNLSPRSSVIEESNLSLKNRIRGKPDNAPPNNPMKVYFVSPGMEHSDTDFCEEAILLLCDKRGQKNSDGHLLADYFSDSTHSMVFVPELCLQQNEETKITTKSKTKYAADLFYILKALSQKHKIRKLAIISVGLSCPFLIDLSKLFFRYEKIIQATSSIFETKTRKNFKNGDIQPSSETIKNNESLETVVSPYATKKNVLKSYIEGFCNLSTECIILISPDRYSDFEDNFIVASKPTPAILAFIYNSEFSTSSAGDLNELKIKHSSSNHMIIEAELQISKLLGHKWRSNPLSKVEEDFLLISTAWIEANLYNRQEKNNHI